MAAETPLLVSECIACAALRADLVTLERELHDLRRTRGTRLVAAEDQSRVATQEARRLDAEVRSLRGALVALDLMAAESLIPNTMRAVIRQALGLPLEQEEPHVQAG